MNKKYTTFQKILLIIQSIFSLLIMGLVSILFMPIVFMARITKQTGKPLSRKILKVYGLIIFFIIRATHQIHVKIHYKDPLPEKPTLIIFNHQTGWEAACILIFFPLPTSFVCKYAYKYYPLLSFFTASHFATYIKRESPREALKILSQDIQTTFKRNRSFVISPEGKRKPPGSKMVFLPGAAFLIKKMKLSQITMLVHNTGIHLPCKKIIRYPGTIHFLSQNIEVDHTLSAKEITADLEKKMEAALIELDEFIC